MLLILSYTLEPLTPTHHRSLLSSINHHSFPALTTEWIWFGGETITAALSQIGLLSASVPVKVCQVFDAPVSAPPPPPPSPVSQRCWLAIAAGQCCLRCAPWASVWREAVTGLSPLALTHLERRKKEKEGAEGVHRFTKHHAPELKKTKRKFPLQDFVSPGFQSVHQAVLGTRAEMRSTSKHGFTQIHDSDIKATLHVLYTSESKPDNICVCFSTSPTTRETPHLRPSWSLLLQPPSSHYWTLSWCQNL